MAARSRKATTVQAPATPLPTANQPAPTTSTLGGISVELLTTINRETMNGACAWLEHFEYQPYLNAGLVQVNEGYPNPANAAQRAVIISDAGKVYLADHAGAAGAPQPAASPFPPATSVAGTGQGVPAAPAANPGTGSAQAAPATRKAADPELLKKMFGSMVLNPTPGELPPPKRGGGAIRQAQPTPLDNLEVGQAFDIPVSAELPNPAKAFQSIVANANRKWSHDSGETEMRDFEVEIIDNNGNPVRDATGAQMVRIEKRPVKIRVQDRKFELRSMYLDDGVSLQGARIQRTL